MSRRDDEEAENSRRNVSNFDDHAGFDRYHLSIGRPAILPANVQRKLMAGFRTAYTNLLCLVIGYYWDLGGYLAPIYSTFSSASSYFGQWQCETWKAFCACIVGAVIGTVISLTWRTVYFQVILLFVFSTWTNRCSLWDRPPKVVCGVAIIMCTLWATLEGQQRRGWAAFHYILTTTLVPYLLTGVTLIFPFPSLAANEAQRKAASVCKKLSVSVSALIRAFCAISYVDLYTAEVDALLNEVDSELNELGVLKSFIVNEAAVFPRLAGLPPALAAFCDTAKKIQVELVGMRCMLPQILNNHTHARFVDHLRQSLGELAADMDVALSIVSEHIASFDPRPPAVQALMLSAMRFISIMRSSAGVVALFRGRGSSSSAAATVGSNNNTTNSNSGSSTAAGAGGQQSGGGAIIRDGGREQGEFRPSSLTANDNNDLQRSKYITESEEVVDIVLQSSAGTVTKQRRKLYDEGDAGDSSNSNSSAHFDEVCLDIETGVSNANYAVLPPEGTTSTGVGDDDTAAAAGAGAHLKQNSSKLSRNRKKEFKITTERLAKWHQRMLDAYQLTRKEYVWRKQTQAPLAAAAARGGAEGDAVVPLHDSEYKGDSSNDVVSGDSSNSSSSINSAMKQPSVTAEKGFRITANTSYIRYTISSVPTVEEPPVVDSDAPLSIQKAEEYAAAVRKENHRYSWKNLFPRGAYLHRVVVLTDLVRSLETVLDAKELPPFSPLSFLWANLATAAEYVYGMGTLFVDTVMFWSAVLCATLCLVSQRRRQQQRDRDDDTLASSENLMVRHGNNSRRNRDDDIFHKAKLRWEETVRTYAQPAKISLAICITSLFALVSELRGQFFVDGVWATVAIGFIRQETVSSSFLVGYQRLEGTAIGTLYSFVTYQGFNCDIQECGLNITLPVIVIWVAFCAFWRNGVRHGYAAVVAAFTPVVLYLGTPSSPDGTLFLAWRRVAETIVGVGVYLIVDNCILPSRSDSIVRAGVITSINDTRKVVVEVVGALQALTSAAKEEAQQAEANNSNNNAATASRADDHASPSSAAGAASVFGENAPSPLSRVPSSSTTHAGEDSDPVPVENDIIKRSTGKSGFLLSFPLCVEHLKSCGDAIARLQSSIAVLTTNLALAPHEPEIWHRAFPSTAYQQLFGCFRSVIRSSQAVASATKATSSVISEMINRTGVEAVDLHLEAYAFMTGHLITVSLKADAALELAMDALHRLYSQNELITDLTAIVTLSRGCDALLTAVDDHFRNVFSAHDFLAGLDTYMILCYQDLFESVLGLVKHLSQLGTALHTVRDAEVLAAT